MPFFVFACLLVFSGTALAQSAPEKLPAVIRALIHGATDAVIAESSHASEAQKTVAAIVQLNPGTAAIVVAAAPLAGEFELVARSKPFALSRESNFGAGLEDFRLTGQDRLEFTLSSRDGCARKTRTYRFALRAGRWLASGLDSTAMRCSERGVVEDFAETTNYLTGRSSRTVFVQAREPQHIRLTSPRQAFPLSAFPPNGPEAAYLELQDSR